MQFNRNIELTNNITIHMNTGPVSKWWSEYWLKFTPVFKWHLDTRQYCNQTTYDHLNTRLVRYSDHHRTELVQYFDPHFVLFTHG